MSSGSDLDFRPPGSKFQHCRADRIFDEFMPNLEFELLASDAFEWELAANPLMNLRSPGFLESPIFGLCGFRWYVIRPPLTAH